MGSCLCVCLVIQLASYNPGTKTRGPIPSWVTAFFDYSWFVLQGISCGFMPRAPSLRMEISHVNDRDYTERVSEYHHSSSARPGMPRWSEVPASRQSNMTDINDMCPTPASCPPHFGDKGNRTKY